MPQAVKFVDGSETRLRILGIPYGGPEYLDHRDLDGEYFSAKTDLCNSWFPVQRPLLYHHGLHPDIDVAPVGKVDSTTATIDEVGVWVEAELDKQGPYYEHIKRIVDARRMFASSGAMPHLVRKAKDGHIDRWPWVEMSLTPTPSNPLATVAAKAVAAHYTAAGITPPPTIDDDDTRSYSDLLDRLTDDVGDFTEMTLRLTAGRLKVGRSLSEVRRRKLADLLGRMRDSAAEIEGLLAETAPAPTERGETPPPAEPEASAPGGEAVAADAEDTSTGKAAAHAPDDVQAIFAQFQKDDAFYGAVLTSRRK